MCLRVSQVQQYGSPYDPYTSCSPRLQSTAYTSTSATGTANAANPGGLHQEATTVYVAGDALPPLASSSSSSLSTTTASYTRYEVVPSSYATTHAIRSSSSSSKVLTVDLPSPDSGIGADAVTPRQDHHPPTALHQVSPSREKRKTYVVPRTTTPLTIISREANERFLEVPRRRGAKLNRPSNSAKFAAV